MNPLLIQLKLAPGDSFDPYLILQGKEDKQFNKIVAQIKKADAFGANVWVPHKGRFMIVPFNADYKESHTKIGDWMITSAVVP